MRSAGAGRIEQRLRCRRTFTLLRPEAGSRFYPELRAFELDDCVPESFAIGVLAKNGSDPRGVESRPKKGTDRAEIVEDLLSSVAYLDGIPEPLERGSG